MNKSLTQLLIVIPFLIFAFAAQAQLPHSKTFSQTYQHQGNDNHPEHPCGTVASPNDINYMRYLRETHQPTEDDFLRNLDNSLRNMPVMNVPIKAHVVRTTAGTGGLTTGQLNAAISTMNSYYINANIQFYLCGAINYIDNSTYYDYDAADENAMAGPNDVANNINIYFMNTATSSGSSLCGYAYFPGGPNRIIMVNSCATNGSTLAHEMGHFYSLYHTHGKSNTGTTDELVNGSNCATKGDDICDTPADPNLSGVVNTSCVYTGTATDANNAPYVPNPNNMMSYSRKACRNFFSAGQYARINSTALNSSFRNSYSCPSASTDDAGLDTIFHPTDGFVFCDNPLIPEVVLHNFSTSSLTSVNIKYQIDNGPISTYAWTGSLGAGATVNVILPGIIPPINPVFTFRAFTSNPNGVADTNNSNDTLTATTQYLVAPSLPYAESFNSGIPTNITIFDQDGDGFEWVPSAINGFGIAGGGSIVMDNYTDDTRGTFDWVLLPTLDFSGVAGAQITFDVAYAKYNTTYSDSMYILVNSNCGTSYTPVYFKGGDDLATAPDLTTGLFSPTAAQWKTETVDLSAYDGMTHVRVAFLNQGGYGQPIYVDNINISAATTCALTASATATSTSCSGGSNGSVTVTAGGSSGYTYNIGSGPQSSNVFNGLTANTYSITVSDGSCATVTSVVVGQPSSAVSASVTTQIPVDCFGGSDGGLTISATGGTPNYTYNIGSGAQSTGSFTGLAANSYTVTVTDNNGCTSTTSTSITQPTAALASSTSSTTMVSCFGGNNGTITFSATGGTPSYTYNIGTGAQSNGSFTGLTASSYTVTVIDDNGCVATTTSAVNQPAALAASPSSATMISCAGGNNGAITFSATGGTPNYTYNIGLGAQSSGSFTGLTANSYTITVSDNNGCTTSSTISITQPTALNSSAADNGNGTATASGSGGTNPYTYLWDANAANQTTATATGLTNNTYTVTITDANGCVTTSNVMVTVVGLQELNQLSLFDVVPNPNTGNFTIRVNFEAAKEASIKITNVLGQTLKEFNFNTQQINIPVDLQEQASGVYFVVLSAESKAVTRKIVVKK